MGRVIERNDGEKKFILNWERNNDLLGGRKKGCEEKSNKIKRNVNFELTHITFSIA